MVDQPTPSTDACPILMFHMLGTPREPLAFPPRRFRDGLLRLAENGYRSHGLLEAAAQASSGAGFPPRSVVLTFDDGFASVHEEGLPVLVELGWTATVFVTTATIGGRSPQGWPVADAGALRELMAGGVSIGGHTVTHPDLTRSTMAEVRSELQDGKERLADLLGEPVRAFAYPFGRFDERSRSVAAELYECACTDALAFARSGDDPLLLPRIDAWYLSRGSQLGRLGSRTTAAYLAARRYPRALRRRASALRR